MADSDQVPGGYEREGTRGATRIKNKNAAPVQITAEQILREANEYSEAPVTAPKQYVEDEEELAEYRMGKRKQFEDGVRKSRLHIGTWLKYAAWEESQHQMDRARSVYERALDVDSRNVTVYLKYSEMEMKHRNINHARNILDRAVTILPRVDQFWFKFTYMEETLGNIGGARQAFERWMGWMPGEGAWMAYVKMELRYEELDRARDIYARFVQCHPDPKNWLKWADFEEGLNDLDKVREVYSEAVEALGDDLADQRVFAAFARFEARMQEYDRARAIYTFALERLPKAKSTSLYRQYTRFEKQHGTTEGIEDVVLARRRTLYEEAIRENAGNYDTWFDYTHLEEEAGDLAAIRDVYERAIAQVPPLGEKRLWRRYIYLWVRYAVWEELHASQAAGDANAIAAITTEEEDPKVGVERARQVWKACLALIPHRAFTFAKIWLMYAHFEVRQGDVAAARKALGQALGRCPKARLYKGYIDLEMRLREFDRCRTLYAKYLQYDPANSAAWIAYTDLERTLGDTGRARALFELAVDQPVLDMPEVLWKAYIDAEVEEEEWARARDVYRRLLRRTGHVKVWVSFTHLEMSIPLGADGGSDTPLIRTRARFEEAYTAMRAEGLGPERVLLLEAWADMEGAHGDAESLRRVQERMPKTVKKRRQVPGGAEGEMEEYKEYIFPDDESSKPNFRLLDLAHQWKRKMAEQAAAASASAPTKEEGEDESVPME